MVWEEAKKLFKIESHMWDIYYNPNNQQQVWEWREEIDTTNKRFGVLLCLDLEEDSVKYLYFCSSKYDLRPAELKSPARVLEMQTLMPYTLN